MLPWQPEFQSDLPKTICNLSYYTVMLCVSFNQDPPTGFGDIDVLMFSHSKSMETIDPGARPNLTPRA